MTKDETREFMAVIRAAYPTFYKDANKEVITTALKLWSIALADVDYSNAQKGFVDYIKTKKFPPTIAEIIEFSRIYKNDFLKQKFREHIQRIQNNANIIIEKE